MANELAVRYTVGEEEIALDVQTVKSYLVTGKVDLVTDQEILFYMKICKAQGLNPFIKDAYLVKYDAGQPAQIIVGKDAFTKRADAMPECRGWMAGVCVVDKSGQYIEREGSVVLPSETLVGGWCSVEKEGWEHPFKHTVSLKEYNTGKSTWAKMPATMIRKVALVQALRDAFPAAFQGMYDSAEISTEEPVSVNSTKAQAKPAKQAEKRATKADSNVIDIAPAENTKLTISAEQKMQITNLLSNNELKIDEARKLLSSYGYHSIKEIESGDFDEIFGKLIDMCERIDIAESTAAEELFDND